MEIWGEGREIPYPMELHHEIQNLYLYVELYICIHYIYIIYILINIHVNIHIDNICAYSHLCVCI